MTIRPSRRELLAAGGSAGLVALAGCSGLLGSDAVEGWPSYQRGPANHGVNPAASGPGADFGNRWQVVGRTLDLVPDEAVQTILSPPVVHDGTVYATLAYVGGESGFHLLAVATADGSLAWETEIAAPFGWNGRVLPQPAVVDGTVVVANSDPASEVPVVGVDAESGDVDWQYDGEQIPVTAVTATDDQYAVGSNTAFALEADGTPNWEFAGGELTAPARPDFPPTITDERVYVPTPDGLYALDHEGTEQWSRSLAFESEIAELYTRPYTPVVDDSVYVTTGNVADSGDGRLLALDPADGTTQWQFKPEFDAERRERWIEAAHRETGRTRPYPVGVYSTPALSDGTLYVPGYELPQERDRPAAAHLYAIDTNSGEQQWSAHLPGSPGHTPPVVAGGTVYVATLDGLLAIDASSGDVIGRGDPTPTFVRRMAVVDETIYASDSATLTAIGPE